MSRPEDSAAARVLITGSRYWEDERAIRVALQAAAHLLGDNLTIVHGAAPGADTIAARVGAEMGFRVEAHPADWSIGKKAGPIRNQQMVDLGADLCLAFPEIGSRGTVHCMGAARRAGIEVKDFGSSSEATR